jgi:hypothetical protein
MEMRGPLPCGAGYIGEGEDKGDQAGAEQGSGVSPLAHHAPQGHAGKIHRLRACARCEGGDRDGTKDYKISDTLVDQLIATP